jgi:aminoglycoside phosphotransferase (APT) family kinase protein
MQPPHFSPDDLSRRAPDLGPVTRDRRDVIQRVLAHYFDPADGLREVRQILTQASLNTNYLLEMASGAYVLKCRAGVDANRAIARECTLLSILAARGVRVPRLVVTRSGVPSLQDDASWMLTAHVPGEHFVGDNHQLEAVAAELGSLVRALREVRLEDDPSPPPPGEFLQELPDLLRSVENGDPSPLRSRVREQSRAILDAMEAVVSERACIETSCSLVHVDLHPMNVLLDGDELACLLDMEDVMIYPLLPALGFAGYKLIRRALGEPSIGTAEGKDLANRWAAACQRALPEIELDSKSLGMGARYRELSRVAYILREHVEHGSFTDGIEASKHLRAFSELDWLFPTNQAATRKGPP